MTVVQCVQMGKDLGLDEHYADHQAGNPCDSSPLECQLKTRIWQTMYVCEVMIGTSQGEHPLLSPDDRQRLTRTGRTDLGVDNDSVDLRIPKPIPGGDESEYLTSRNFTYFARIVHNIGRMSRVYARIKKKKEWGIDPSFMQLNPSFNTWISDLPPDMAISYPPDGSAPWLASPFIGNVHSYFHLSLILLHRPQLTFLDPNAADGQWKHHMMICYQSAKAICRLQEAVLNSFSPTGLQSMQRGFSYSVYCGLSCIVLHLVSCSPPCHKTCSTHDSNRSFHRWRSSRRIRS